MKSTLKKYKGVRALHLVKKSALVFWEKKKKGVRVFRKRPYFRKTDPDTPTVYQNIKYIENARIVG